MESTWEILVDNRQKIYRIYENKLKEEKEKRKKEKEKKVEEIYRKALEIATKEYNRILEEYKKQGKYIYEAKVSEAKLELRNLLLKIKREIYNEVIKDFSGKDLRKIEPIIYKAINKVLKEVFKDVPGIQKYFI